MSVSTVQIIILRHAHAAKAAAGQMDFDRPLDERGRREAIEIGAQAARLGLSPTLILCSPARRTRETLLGSGFARSGAEIAYIEALYPGDAGQYLQALQGAPTNGSILLIGHNPGIAELAAHLAGSGEREALERLARGVPPAGLAAIEFDGPGGTVAEGRGRLLHFLRPNR